MKEFKIDNKGSGRLFSNKLLEGLTRTHFLIPVLLYYAIASLFAVWMWLHNLVPLIHIVWLFPAGMIFFTLVEYLIHRFIFHFDAKSEKEINLQYHIHGVHHEFPRDKDRLVMPPVLSVCIAGIFFLFFRLLFAQKGIILFSGFCAGYSTYLIIHFYVHARKPPRNFLKFYWTHHSLHHYHSVHSAFSVSFPFWDYVFGTMPDKKSYQVRESATGSRRIDDPRENAG